VAVARRTQALVSLEQGFEELAQEHRGTPAAHPPRKPAPRTSAEIEPPTVVCERVPRVPPLQPLRIADNVTTDLDKQMPHVVVKLDRNNSIGRKASPE
jgi:hypothetical protein